MSNNGKFLAGVIAIGALSVGVLVLPSLPAGASASSVQSSPMKGLLGTSQAHQLGFTNTVTKPTSSTKTGVAGCSKGAQVVYENGHKTTGLISEVLVCSSPNGAAALIKKEKKVGTASPVKAPQALGGTALERVSQGSTYAIFWQRGKLLELVAFDADLSTSSSTSATAKPKPLSSGQKQTLAKAAIDQDATTK